MTSAIKVYHNSNIEIHKINERQSFIQIRVRYQINKVLVLIYLINCIQNVKIIRDEIRMILIVQFVQKCHINMKIIVLFRSIRHIDVEIIILF